MIDLLDVSPCIVSLVCRDAYLGLVQRSPRLVGRLFRYLDRPGAGGLRGRMLWTALGRARQIVSESGAGAIVSTHFLASEMVARMRATGGAARRGAARQGGAVGAPLAPLDTVVTDVDAHGLWIWPETDRYFVAGDQAAATLERAKVPRESIEITGIPIDPAYERPPPRHWARHALGVAHDRPLVLFSSGGSFVGPVEAIARALARLRGPAQIVIICGRAEKARRRLAEAARDLVLAPGVSLRIEGFTDRMHVWMAAADLFVGKPGGLSSAECRAASLPMLIANAIPGHEEHNANELVRQGAAQRVPHPRELTAIVDQLLARGGSPTLAAMRRAAAAAAKPAAARRVADLVISRMARLDRRSRGSRLDDATPFPWASRRAG